MHSQTADLTYLTADLPGVGGVIKQRPEDFLVEEQPLYEPSGEGEHLYVYIEKRSRTTTEVARHLARVFHVSRRNVGYAGLKDKHAITRQHFSIHLPKKSGDEEGLARINNNTVTLLWAARHGNMLRRGHLSGNRFVIRIREINPAHVVHAKATLDRLAAAGVPNFLGEQRFGYRQNNHIIGRLLLLEQWQELLDEMLGHPRDEREPTHVGRLAYERGDYAQALEVWPRHLRHDRQALDVLRQGRSARDAVLTMDREQRGFFISGLQSAMFNRVLDQRLRDGTLAQLLVGDLAMKHSNGAIFAVDAATAETENAAPEGRMHTQEISPTGPMWGPDMPRPTNGVLAAETRVLHAFDLNEDDLAGRSVTEHVPTGSRRALRIFLRDPDISAGVDEHGPFIRVAFELPRGSFATIALREIMKTQVAEEEA